MQGMDFLIPRIKKMYLNALIDLDHRFEINQFTKPSLNNLHYLI